MGSTDETLELCRAFEQEVAAAGEPCPAVKILHGDGGPRRLIHVNKNVGIEEATGAWILNLDADERLSASLRGELVEAIASAPPAVGAFALPFTHYFFGKYLKHGGFRGSLIRLFRKGRLRYPEDRAHSTPVVDGEVKELKGLVVHFNHRRVADFITKLNRYTSSDAPLLLENGRGGLRNRPLPRNLVWAMVKAPLSVFWSRFIRHAGFLDGVHGLVAATLLAYYQFVEYAKVWEARLAAGNGEGTS